MRIDLDSVISKVLPWDLVVAADGVDYRVRPLKLADLFRLQEVETLPQREGLELLAGLFEDPKPDLGAWDGYKVGAATMAVIKYFQEHSRKNSQAAGAQVAAAIESNMASPKP